DVLDDLAGSGQGVFGETRPLEIASRKSHFWLEDEHAGAPSEKTYSAEGGARLPGHEVGSTHADRWDTDVEGAGAAVDAHYFMSAVTGYYARVHGRAGALGDGHG